MRFPEKTFTVDKFVVCAIFYYIMFRTADKLVNDLTKLGTPHSVARELLNYPINACRELLVCNNCYSWAVGDLFLHALSMQEMDRNNYIQWIGDASGVRRSVWDIAQLDYEVQGYLEQDGAYFISRDTPALPSDGFTQIFVASDNRGYGHVYRQNHYDGMWSHKIGPGSLVSGYADAHGEYGLIENPYASYRMGYNIPVGFFKIPVGKQIGIKGYENKLAQRNLPGDLGKYLSETQFVRDKCFDLNVRAAKLDKVPNGYGCEQFEQIINDYAQVKTEFEQIANTYKSTVNRHNLLQVEYMRNQEQFMD